MLWFAILLPVMHAAPGHRSAVVADTAVFFDAFDATGLLTESLVDCLRCDRSPDRVALDAASLLTESPFGTLRTELRATRSGALMEGGKPRFAVSGPLSGIHTPSFTIIRNEEQLRSVWEKHCDERIGHPAPPPIDFRSRMFIAYFAGDQPGGVRATIRAYQGANGIYAVPELDAPSGAYPEARTQPYVFYELPAETAIVGSVALRSGDLGRTK
jgi:hypothetical protein